MSFGTLVYGPMTQVLLDTYGWRGAMMILGGMTFHLVPCAVVSQTADERNGTDSYHRIPADDGARSRDTFQTQNESGTDRKIYKKILAAFDFAILTDVRFILQTLSVALLEFCFVGWAVYVVPHGLKQGLSPMQSSFLPTLYGIGNILGKGITPLLLKTKVLNDWWIMNLGLLLSGVFFVVDPFVRSFGALLIVTCVLGLGSAVCNVARVLICRSTTSDDRFLGFYSWQSFFVGIIEILSGFISGRNKF